jgi:hypothetical protein
MFHDGSPLGCKSIIASIAFRVVWRLMAVA